MAIIGTNRYGNIYGYGGASIKKTTDKSFRRSGDSSGSDSRGGGQADGGTSSGTPPSPVQSVKRVRVIYDSTGRRPLFRQTFNPDGTIQSTVELGTGRERKPIREVSQSEFNKAADRRLIEDYNRTKVFKGTLQDYQRLIDPTKQNRLTEQTVRINESEQAKDVLPKIRKAVEKNQRAILEIDNRKPITPQNKLVVKKGQDSQDFRVEFMGKKLAAPSKSNLSETIDILKLDNKEIADVQRLLRQDGLQLRTYAIGDKTFIKTDSDGVPIYNMVKPSAKPVSKQISQKVNRIAQKIGDRIDPDKRVAEAIKTYESIDSNSDGRMIAGKVLFEFAVGLATGGATRLITAKSLPALAAKSSKLYKAANAALKTGEVFYVGSLPVRAVATGGDVKKLALEFAGDAGFVAGLKLGGVSAKAIRNANVNTKPKARDVFKKYLGTVKPTLSKLKSGLSKASNAVKAELIGAWIELKADLPRLQIRSGPMGKRASFRLNADRTPKKSLRQRKPVSKAQLRKMSLNRAYDPNLKFIRDRNQVVKITRPKNSDLKKVVQRITSSGDYVVQHTAKGSKTQLVTKYSQDGSVTNYQFKNNQKKLDYPKSSQLMPKRGRADDYEMLAIHSDKGSTYFLKQKDLIKAAIEVPKFKRKGGFIENKVVQTTKDGQILRLKQGQAPKTFINVPTRSPSEKPTLFIKGWRKGRSIDKFLDRLQTIKNTRYETLEKGKVDPNTIETTELALAKFAKQFPQYRPPQHDVVFVDNGVSLPKQVTKVDIKQLPALTQQYLNRVGVRDRFVYLDIPDIKDDLLMKEYLDFKLANKDKSMFKERIKDLIINGRIVDAARLPAFKELQKESLLTAQDVKQITQTITESGSDGGNNKPKEPKPKEPQPKDKIPKDKPPKQPKPKKPKEKIPKEEVIPPPQGKSAYLFIPPNLDDEENKKKKPSIIPIEQYLQYSPTLKAQLLGIKATRTSGVFSGLEERGIPSRIVTLNRQGQEVNFKKPTIVVAKKGIRLDGVPAKVREYRRRIPKTHAGKAIPMNVKILKKYNMLMRKYKK